MVETIVIVVLVLIVVGVALGFANAIFKRRKKAKKTAKEQVKSESEQPSADKPAQSEPVPEHFKISKKERHAKISRKALKTDSRTGSQAVIEPVYARTPSMPEQTSDIEVDQRLSIESEQFLQALGGADTNGRHVVSLGDIKREQDAAKAAQTVEEQPQEPQDEWSRGQGLKKDLWSSMQARGFNIDATQSDDFYGHFTGNYSGIKVGGAVDIKSEQNANSKPATSNVGGPATPGVPPITPMPATGGWKNANANMNLPDMDEIMARNPFGSSPFGRPVIPSAAKKPAEDFDISKAVVAEAILNRKGKPIKKQNRDKK